MSESLLTGPAPVPLAAALTKTDHAYAAIRERILTGELAPGDALDQSTLAAALQVSTTPLREALRRLESDGLVVGRAHHDTVVAPMSFATLGEVSLIRMTAEPLAVRLACQHASDAELRAIAAFAKSGPPSKDPIALTRWEGTIHRQIYSASRNVSLIRVLDSLSDATDRYRALVLRTNPGLALHHRSHARIIARMVARDADAAATLMREHIEGGFRRMAAAHQEL